MQELRATAAQQQKEIQILTASIKEQAAQIHKVSDELELSKTSAPNGRQQSVNLSFAISHHASPCGGFLLEVASPVNGTCLIPRSSTDLR